LLNEGYVEHDSSKVLIAELIASAPNEEFYGAKVKVLSEQIEHHVHEEEKRSEGISTRLGKQLQRFRDRISEDDSPADLSWHRGSFAIACSKLRRVRRRQAALCDLSGSQGRRRWSCR
jgi:hypothetical protein